MVSKTILIHCYHPLAMMLSSEMVKSAASPHYIADGVNYPRVPKGKGERKRNKADRWK